MTCLIWTAKIDSTEFRLTAIRSVDLDELSAWAGRYMCIGRDQRTLRAGIASSTKSTVLIVLARDRESFAEHGLDQRAD